MKQTLKKVNQKIGDMQREHANKFTTIIENIKTIEKKMDENFKSKEETKNEQKQIDIGENENKI